MDESEKPLWRIDAWDSLAGRAFLCRRFPDGPEDPRLDQPAVFVSPPFFEPEPLASRAPGLAATRGTAQAGFFIDGEEVGFATMADAIAYIRRAYNSRGFDPPRGAPVVRREGPTGGGGSGLARELPELPRATGYRQLDLAIAACKADFLEAAGYESNARATPVSWHVDEKLTANAAGMLALAGEALMREMLWRFPAKGPAEDYSGWLDAAHRLGRQLVRLGLWERVAQRCAAQFKMRFDDLWKAFAIGLPDHQPKDFGIEPTLWLVDAIFANPNRMLLALERTDETAIYDDLALFPVPPTVAARYPTSTDRVPTVLALLSAWFAHPNSIEGATSLDRAFLLFGGACVVVGHLQRESPTFKPWWIDQNSQTRHAFESRLGAETWRWLSTQLPDRAFHHRLEDTLPKISRIWTVIDTIGPSDPIKHDRIGKISEYDLDHLRNELGEILSEDEHDHVYHSLEEADHDVEAEAEQVQSTRFMLEGP